MSAATAPLIQWSSEFWGQPGHNVHVASNGSHVDAEASEVQ